MDSDASAKKKIKNTHRLVKSHGFISERIHHGHRQDEGISSRSVKVIVVPPSNDVEGHAAPLDAEYMYEDFDEFYPYPYPPHHEGVVHYHHYHHQQQQDEQQQQQQQQHKENIEHQQPTTHNIAISSDDDSAILRIRSDDCDENDDDESEKSCDEIFASLVVSVHANYAVPNDNKGLIFGVEADGDDAADNNSSSNNNNATKKPSHVPARTRIGSDCCHEGTVTYA